MNIKINQNSMKFCPECGTKNEVNSLFCGNCGTNLKESQPTKPQTQEDGQQEYQTEKIQSNEEVLSQTAQSDVNICPNCESVQSRDSVFCGNCGSSISNTTTQPPPNTQNKSAGSVTTNNYQPPQHTTTSQDSREFSIKSHPQYKDTYTGLLISMLIPGFAHMWIGRWEYGIGFLVAIIITMQIVPSLFLLGVLIYIAQLYYGKQVLDEYNNKLNTQYTENTSPNSNYMAKTNN